MDGGCCHFCHDKPGAAFYHVSEKTSKWEKAMTDILYYRMTRESETVLSSASAAWLLPIVSCVVAAASGGIVAEALPHPQHALGTIIASYVLWGIGVPLALMVMVIYLLRLILYKLPPKALIVSMFLPLGPLGQGGYG